MFNRSLRHFENPRIKQRGICLLFRFMGKEMFFSDIAAYPGSICFSVLKATASFLKTEFRLVTQMFSQSCL